MSFDIKFTRQGFENACWHREACRAIQHAFSKPSLVNFGTWYPLISLPMVKHSSNYRLWHNFWFLCWISVICDVIQKVQRHHDLIKVTWDRKRLLGYVETIQLILRVTDNWAFTVYILPLQEFRNQNIVRRVQKSKYKKLLFKCKLMSRIRDYSAIHEKWQSCTVTNEEFISQNRSTDVCLYSVYESKPCFATCFVQWTKSR